MEKEDSIYGIDSSIGRAQLTTSCPYICASLYFDGAINICKIQRDSRSEVNYGGSDAHIQKFTLKQLITFETLVEEYSCSSIVLNSNRLISSENTNMVSS